MSGAMDGSPRWGKFGMIDPPITRLELLDEAPAWR